MPSLPSLSSSLKTALLWALPLVLLAACWWPVQALQRLQTRHEQLDAQWLLVQRQASALAALRSQSASSHAPQSATLAPEQLIEAIRNQLGTPAVVQPLDAATVQAQLQGMGAAELAVALEALRSQHRLRPSAATWSVQSASSIHGSITWAVPRAQAGR